MKPIMENFPDGFIDYNRLKLILAILEYEYGIVGRDNGCPESLQENISSTPDSTSTIKRKIPSWISSYTSDSLKAATKKHKPL